MDFFFQFMLVLDEMILKELEDLSKYSVVYLVGLWRHRRVAENTAQVALDETSNSAECKHEQADVLPKIVCMWRIRRCNLPIQLSEGVNWSLAILIFIV